MDTYLWFGRKFLVRALSQCYMEHSSNGWKPFDVL